MDDVLKSKLKHFKDHALEHEEEKQPFYFNTTPSAPKREDNISNKITFHIVDKEYLQYIRKKKILPRKLSESNLTVISLLDSGPLNIKTR